MNFDLTDDRRMLAETLTRFLAEACPIATRTNVAYTAPFHDPKAWQGLTELGLFYAFAHEDQGGMGGTGFDVTTVFEALGAALCCEPVLGQLMAIKALADPAAALDGTRFALALEGEVTVQNGRLSGRKSVVYGAGTAERLLVIAQGHLFEVAPSAAQITPYGMIDGGGAAEVFLDDCPATDHGPVDLSDVQDWGRLALCAEAVGAMGTALDMLLEYLKTREQFGQKIGQFQALQHRMVDLRIEQEQARSITILAASKMGTPEQGHYSAMAKHLVGRVAQQVAEESIQMQGGIAMTWDYPASHFAKRLVMIDHQLGDQDQHLETVMAALQA